MEYASEHNGIAVKWRGWIGLNGKSIAAKTVEGSACFKCGRPIVSGEVISKYWNREDCHWACLFGSADVPDTLVAQWIGAKIPGDDGIAYAAYPGGEGWINRGGLLDIEPREGQIVITEASSEEEKEAGKADAYRRLTKVIDERSVVTA